MLIDQMHTYFRQYAQQMGMQNVRAILPEQIDLLINTSISDIVNKIIQENIGITSDRIISDNSKIGQVNALRTLYNVIEVSFTEKNSAKNAAIIGLYDNFPGIVFAIDIAENGTILTPVQMATKLAGLSDRERHKVAFYIPITQLQSSLGALLASTLNNIDKSIVKSATVGEVVMPTTSGTGGTPGSVFVDVTSSKPITIYTYGGSSITNFDTTAPSVLVSTSFCDANDTEATNIFNVGPDSIYSGLIRANKLLSDFLFLVDFSVNYKAVVQGIQINNVGSTVYKEGDELFTSNYFPVRLIDDVYLADTLNDFVLKPRLRSPILTVYNDSVYDFYIDSFIKKGSYYEFKEGLLPYKIRCSYVKKPAKVLYGVDLNVKNVDCDLPDYLHVDIVKHAVDLYRVAVQGAPMIGQRSQNQENTPNNQS